MPWTRRGKTAVGRSPGAGPFEMQRQHDELARPSLMQAARLRLRGNALVDWLDANHVPPRGNTWTRMTEQRIRRLDLC